MAASKGGMLTPIVPPNKAPVTCSLTEQGVKGSALNTENVLRLTLQAVLL